MVNTTILAAYALPAFACLVAWPAAVLATAPAAALVMGFPRFSAPCAHRPRRGLAKRR